MPIVLIGIDDTDNDTSPGTGQLARRLARELEQHGAKLHGITRHQFLLDDRIAYSTHNSGACLALEWIKPISDLNFAYDMIAGWSADGSDPGMCVALSDSVVSDVMQWGWAATRQVLSQDQAVALAKVHGLDLRALGGTGDGIIGALASIGLRTDGNEGRFLDLPGLRELDDIVTIKQLEKLGIHVAHTAENDHNAESASHSSGGRARYMTHNWVRPRLVQGRPVWPVEWSEDDHAWIAIDHKKSRPLE
jgi:hypothetical protein